LSTKIHMLVDAVGNPIAFFLTGGQAHDLAGADELLPKVHAGALVADKAFDAEQRVIEPLLAAGITPVIPPKSTRKTPRPFDKELARLAISSRTSYASSSSSARSPPATTKPLEISSLASTSPPRRSCSIEDRP
jgi:transposase